MSFTPYFLLGCFADFYEEVASLKLAAAHSEGELAVYLTAADGSKPTAATDFAARVGGRLETFLRQQESDVRRQATVAQARMYALTQYVMTAVADEIFILDLSWSGRAAWLPFLLEQKLFHSNNAGTRFFELADQLLHTHQHSALHIDAACVFLLALQLGFKGQYRGRENEAALHDYRQRLYRLANLKPRADGQPAFEQAYQHRLCGTQDMRLAPLSRWYAAAKIALAAYLALSTIVWVILLYPFVQAFGA